mgnify:CR=1 FL=1
MMKRSMQPRILSCALVLALAACGGSGGGGDPLAQPTELVDGSVHNGLLQPPASRVMMPR